MVEIPKHVAILAGKVGVDPNRWINNCHVAALDLVNSGLYPEARVARGSAKGVPGQHSWVVTGNPYDDSVTIIDPTIWCYSDDIDDVWIGSARSKVHTPHGAGSIWNSGRPESAHRTGEAPIFLLQGHSRSDSVEVRAFLEMCGPLGVRGWMQLFNSPVGGWPAREIVGKAFFNERLKPLIPVDVVGMLTNINPKALYLPGKELTETEWMDSNVR